MAAAARAQGDGQNGDISMAPGTRVIVPDRIGPRPTGTCCDSITPPRDEGGDMNIEMLERPIEPQSAIMKGN
jgi:hypothetical protein